MLTMGALPRVAHTIVRRFVICTPYEGMAKQGWQETKFLTREILRNA
jgi:hypothetical protein